MTVIASGPTHSAASREATAKQSSAWQSGDCFVTMIATKRDSSSGPLLAMTPRRYCAGWWQVVQLSAVKLAWLAGEGLIFPAP